MSTRVGQTVSHYNILEHPGGRGIGVVHKVQDLKLDRPVALKFLPPDLTRDPEAEEADHRSNMRPLGVVLSEILLGLTPSSEFAKRCVVWHQHLRR